MFSRHRNLVILASVLFLQLSLLAYQFRRAADVPLIRHGTMYLVTPVQKALRASTDAVFGVVNGYLDLREARRQSQDLTRELDQMKLETQRLRHEAEQARRLQALLEFRQEIPLATLAARVIGSGASETSQTVILDKGSSAGLRPDLPVMVPAGIVGKVLRVFANTAQVLLLTDANSGVACLLESSRIHGVLKGKNKPLAQLGYVNNGDKVEVGETLVTSGEDRIYPKGLPVGVVVAVRPGPEFQEIEVQPFVQLNRLEEVLVILERGTSVETAPTSMPVPGAGPAAGGLEQKRPSTVPEAPSAQPSPAPPRPATPPLASPPGETRTPRSQPPAGTLPLPAPPPAAPPPSEPSAPSPNSPP